MNLDLYKIKIIDDGDYHLEINLIEATFKNGDMTIIKMLSNKYDINYDYIDSDGNNLLHNVINCHSDIHKKFNMLKTKILFLLRKKVDINHKNIKDLLLML